MDIDFEYIPADLAEAYAAMTGTLIGKGCEYTYTNTKPEYDISGEGPHNKHLTRVVDR